MIERNISMSVAHVRVWVKASLRGRLRHRCDARVGARSKVANRTHSAYKNVDPTDKVVVAATLNQKSPLLDALPVQASPADADVQGPAGLVPRLKLDELLGELQSQLNAVMSTRDRMSRLLAAVVSIGEDLDLQAVLRRIIEVSVSLVDAEYGALGVIREDGELSQFITVGIGEEHTSTNQPSRSCGVRASHPPMSSFIEVPIRVRNEVFGNLYFTEKRGGRDFDDADVSLVEALASAAGIAISNARMYESTRRRERFLQASTDLHSSLIDDVEPATMLELVAKQSQTLTGAEVAAVLLPKDGKLTFATVVGAGREAFAGRELPIDNSLAGLAFLTGKGAISANVDGEAAAAPGWAGTHPYGPMMFEPLTGTSGPLGVLMVGRMHGGSPFEAADQGLLDGFASQASVALERAQQRQEIERMSRFEERDQLARGMHEAVIQRLFTSVVRLDGINPMLDPHETSRRAHEIAEELTETIRVIRDTIYVLNPVDGA